MKIITIFHKDSFWKFENLYRDILYSLDENACLHIEKLNKDGLTSTLFVFKEWDRFEISSDD